MYAKNQKTEIVDKILKINKNDDTWKMFDDMWEINKKENADQ